MASFMKGRALGLGLALVGFGLMNVAMFLHPMSPEDFLAQLLSNPLLTLADTQGGTVAIFFWFGALAFLAGFVRLANSLAHMCRSWLAHGGLRHSLPH